MLPAPSGRAGRCAWLGVALFAVAVVGTGCKKKAPDMPPDADLAGGWGDVEVTLQVVAVSPESVPANTPVTVRVLGAGFQPGAAVQVGEVAAQTNLVDENTLTVAVPPMTDGVYDVTVRNPDGRARTLHAALTVGAGQGAARVLCRDVIVYFALDQAGVTDAARAAIDENLPCYTQSSTRLRVEGHADERGTTDYNLALGQRRAESVRGHLVRGGVQISRIAVLSYGEERPVDRGTGEAAWSKNRRVEVRLDR